MRSRALLPPLLLLAGALLVVAPPPLEARPESDTADDGARGLAGRARAWLATLDDAERRQAMLPYASAERRDWHYVPRDRRGLAFSAMDARQRERAMALLDAALSASGAEKARGVFALEAELRAALSDAVRRRHPAWRDPGAFHVALFDLPREDGRWGLRIEGHHLSVNLSVDAGRVVAATPLFFGANPTRVRGGPRAGLRPLAHEEDLARALFVGLDAEGRREALVSTRAPGDVAGGPGRAVAPTGRGLALSAMEADTRARFLALVRRHLEAAPSDFAAARLAEVEATAPDRLRFLWFGSARAGEPHAYRIEGPTLYVEYVNRGDHIHTVWRDPRGDFVPVAAPAR